MSVEEIRKKYAAAYENDFEDEQMHTSTESEEEEEEDGGSASSDTSEEEEQDMEAEDEESEEVGIDYLTKNLDVEDPALLKVVKIIGFISPHFEPPFWSIISPE